jgi:D-alanine-D-alanine ligase
MDSSELIVVFGGASGERRVSVASAQHIVEVLDGPEAWFVAPDGRVYLAPRDALARHERPFETDFVPSGPARFETLPAALDSARARGAVFVLGFHGGAGEDGTTQAEFERRGIAFTGSGSRASALAFDKAAAKRVAREHGVATAEAVLLPAGDPRAAREALEGLFARHGRAVAKPVADGSSVGLFHVREARDVESVLAAVRDKPDVPYLAEAFVEGRELTIGVADFGRGARPLPASEVRIAPGRAFDYEGKYLGKGTLEITPAEVSEDVARAAQALGLAMHTALGCEGYSRTDVIVGERGPVFLETNTLPGLTRASFLPQQLAAEGTTVRDFLAAQVALAKARRDRARG